MRSDKAAQGTHALPLLVVQGTFRGVLDEAHQLEAFRGIRYALPPINELRFRRPKPVWEGPLPDRLDPHNRTTSDGKFDASFYGPSCAQYIPPAFMAYRPPVPPESSQEVSSEDCLSAYGRRDGQGQDRVKRAADGFSLAQA